MKTPYKRNMHNFGVNSHLEVRPVGAHFDVRVTPFGGQKRALWWVATVRLVAVIVSRNDRRRFLPFSVVT